MRNLCHVVSCCGLFLWFVQIFFWSLLCSKSATQTSIRAGVSVQQSHEVAQKCNVIQLFLFPVQHACSLNESEPIMSRLFIVFLALVLGTCLLPKGTWNGVERAFHAYYIFYGNAFSQCHAPFQAPPRLVPINDRLPKYFFASLGNLGNLIEWLVFFPCKVKG